MMMSLKTLMPATSELMKTCCFKIRRHPEEETVIFFLDFKMRARTSFIYLLFLNLMKLWQFRSAGGPMQEVRLLHLVINLRQIFLFFVDFQQDPVLVVEMINYVVSFTLVIGYNCLTIV